MASNQSSLPKNQSVVSCFFQVPDRNFASPAYIYMTTATCVINAIFAVGAVLGNALMLTAIWRTPSFRTPSNAFVAGLAVTDFLVGLLLQPSFIIGNVGRIKRLTEVSCVGNLIVDSLGPFLSLVSAFTLSAIALERHYHIKYRKNITIKTVISVYALFLSAPLIFIVPRFWISAQRDRRWYGVIVCVFGSLYAVFCLTAILASYFQIFRIIRRHQMQINVNQGSVSGGHTSIDIQKYRKSVITMLYILGLFLLSYVPYVICSVFFWAIPYLYGSFSMAMGFLNMSATVIFISSTLNPVLYCWRIREIRIFVKSALNNFYQSVTRKCVR